MGRTLTEIKDLRNKVAHMTNDIKLLRGRLADAKRKTKKR